MRNEIANALENTYGKAPEIGDVTVGGKNVNLDKVINALVFIPKRAKLFGSFFQLVDFLTRAGTGGTSAAVNALRT